MNPLRVCHVIHNTEFGGTETMLFQLLRQLAGKHEMSVVSLMRCGEIGERIQRLGIPVYAVECAERGKPKPQRLVRLVQQIRKLKPDVVQTWAYHADLCGGVAARLATRATVLWNIRHATLDSELDSRNVLRSAKLCARLSSWVPDRILLNAHAAIDVHAQAGYHRRKMQVVPNGFDVDRFRPLAEARQQLRAELAIGEGIPLIGMCGRFHPHKGQAEFVKVAARVVQTWPTANFLIAGNRCDEHNIELTTWIENAGLSGQFHLLGSRSDVPAILNALDVFVLSSMTEGMPNVVGEAMACGVNVVATDVGDARRLLGDSGMVVPVQDIPRLSQAIAKYLEKSVVERRALGQRARKRIQENFEISHIAATYEQAWQETLARRAERRSSSRLPAVLPLQSAAGQQTATPRYRPKLVHVTTIPMTQWHFLRGQNQFMAEHGFDVHSVSSPGPYMPKLRERDPVTTHEIKITRRITPVRDLISAYRLWRLFRQLRPEIVQLSTPKAALLGAIAARAAHVPIRIYQVRGLSSESELGVKRALYQQFERFTAGLSNAHLVNAQSLLTYAQRVGILAGGLVARSGMSNGVDLVRFNPETVQPADLAQWGVTHASLDGPVIGYLGRLTRDKGLEDLFAAWKVLRGEFSSARLLLVGPWESENAVSPACRDGLGDDPRVIMTGTQDDVVSFYKAMDLFVFPSHGTEGFPNAPMEAAAMALPVVATRVVGCVDAVEHDVTGRIVSPRSPQQLEEALRDYLRDPGLRTQHGKAGRERIRTGFAPPDLWAEFRDYYLHLLRREGLPLPSTDQDETHKKAA